MLVGSILLPTTYPPSPTHKPAGSTGQNEKSRSSGPSLMPSSIPFNVYSCIRVRVSPIASTSSISCPKADAVPTAKIKANPISSFIVCIACCSVRSLLYPIQKVKIPEHSVLRLRRCWAEEALCSFRFRQNYCQSIRVVAGGFPQYFDFVLRQRPPIPAKQIGGFLYSHLFRRNSKHESDAAVQQRISENQLALPFAESIE